jgi:hypothetical protein
VISPPVYAAAECDRLPPEMTDPPIKPFYSRRLDPIGIIGCVFLLIAMFNWEDGRFAIQMLIVGIGLLGINFLRWRKR